MNEKYQYVILVASEQYWYILSNGFLLDNQGKLFQKNAMYIALFLRVCLGKSVSKK